MLSTNLVALACMGFEIRVFIQTEKLKFGYIDLLCIFSGVVATCSSACCIHFRLTQCYNPLHFLFFLRQPSTTLKVVPSTYISQKELCSLLLCALKRVSLYIFLFPELYPSFIYLLCSRSDLKHKYLSWHSKINKRAK